MTDPVAHEARKQALMANEHISWLGTANRLAEMVDELIEAQRALLDDLAASRAQLEQMREAAKAVLDYENAPYSPPGQSPHSNSRKKAAS